MEVKPNRRGANQSEKATGRINLHIHLEREFEEHLRLLGLEGWTVHWKPDPNTDKRGEARPQERLILIYDTTPEEALTTLIHEALEIKLRKLLNPYTTLLNKLIETIENHIYKEKENLIESLTPIITKTLTKPNQQNLKEPINNTIPKHRGWRK